MAWYINTRNQINRPKIKTDLTKSILSGSTAAINKILDLAKEEGALNTRNLPISAPFHLGILKKASEDLKDFLEDINIKDPSYKIISGIDQKIITTKEDIQSEIVRNITNKINWYKIMKTLLRMDIKTFFECGPGKNLFKIGKFIEGDFTIYTLKTLDKFKQK